MSDAEASFSLRDTNIKHATDCPCHECEKSPKTEAEIAENKLEGVYAQFRAHRWHIKRLSPLTHARFDAVEQAFTDLLGHLRYHEAWRQKGNV